MLGQHLVGDQHAVGIQAAEGDDALPFAEQVGKDAAVADGHILGIVGHHELHVQRVGRAAHRAFLDHTAGTDARILRRLSSSDLRRRVEQIDVLLQRTQRQAHSDADPGEDPEDDEQAFLA
ncbi:hypothetical protein D3C80_1375140 [compost metagenome]